MNVLDQVEFQKSTILVAEDTREIRMALQAVFEDEGYDVVAGANGAEAIKKFMESKPDAAVLDLRMPDMSGADVCKFIRSRSDIPVIILSAVATETEKIAAIEAGADDYLVKGIGMNELLARIAGQLRRHKNLKSKTIAAVADSLPGTHGDESDGTVESNQSEVATTILIATDVKKDREMIFELLNKNGNTVLQASDGEEALAMASVKKPNLIIIKDRLPKMTGFRVLANLRAEGLAHDASVIVLSENGTPKDKARAKVLGASDFIVLPLTLTAGEIELRVGWALTSRVRLRRKIYEIEERKRNNGELLDGAA